MVCLIIVEAFIIVFLGRAVGEPPVDDALGGLPFGTSVDDPPVDDEAGCGGVFSGSSFFNASR